MQEIQIIDRSYNTTNGAVSVVPMDTPVDS